MNCHSLYTYYSIVIQLYNIERNFSTEHIMRYLCMLGQNIFPIINSSYDKKICIILNFQLLKLPLLYQILLM